MWRIYTNLILAKRCKVKQRKPLTYFDINNIESELEELNIVLIILINTFMQHLGVKRHEIDEFLKRKEKRISKNRNRKAAA
jgi:NTP pyrophosphatase (non-canonical NTP hydrolase)